MSIDILYRENELLDKLKEEVVKLDQVRTMMNEETVALKNEKQELKKTLDGVNDQLETVKKQLQEEQEKVLCVVIINFRH